MQNAQLNKQRWITERKSKLGVKTQTKLFCKSSLGSLVRNNKTPIWEKVQERTDLQRCDKKRKKARPFFFFFSVLTCFVKSVLNIKVSIYTGAVYTEQQGQKRVERTKGSEGRNLQKLATTLRQVLLVRNNVKILLLCCCCSNYTISTTFLSLPETYQDKVARVAETNCAASSVTNGKCVVFVTLTACLQFFSLLTGKRVKRCFSSSTQNECSHCEQHRHQVSAGPFISYRYSNDQETASVSATAEISSSTDSDVAPSDFCFYEESVWQRREDTLEFLLQDFSLQNIHWYSVDQSSPPEVV